MHQCLRRPPLPPHLVAHSARPSEPPRPPRRVGRPILSPLLPPFLRSSHLGSLRSPALAFPLLVVRYPSQLHKRRIRGHN